MVKRIEGVQTNKEDKPLQKVEITQSGVMDLPQPLEVSKEGVTAWKKRLWYFEPIKIVVYNPPFELLNSQDS